MTLSRHCAQGTHGFCEGCECPSCHFICPKCETKCRSVSSFPGCEGWCAECVREQARGTRFKGTPCDQCGTVGAWRNPRHHRNEYLCTRCHQASGEKISLVGSVAGIIASCASKPLTDREHEMIHVRGQRHRCRRCHQDTWLAPTKINVVGSVG